MKRLFLLSVLALALFSPTQAWSNPWLGQQFNPMTMQMMLMASASRLGQMTNYPSQQAVYDIMRIHNFGAPKALNGGAALGLGIVAQQGMYRDWAARVSATAEAHDAR